MTLAAPVVVQDVASADPDRSVMVYSDPDRGPDRGVTVIWVFAPNEQARASAQLAASDRPSRSFASGASSDCGKLSTRY